MFIEGSFAGPTPASHKRNMVALEEPLQSAIFCPPSVHGRKSDIARLKGGDKLSLRKSGAGFGEFKIKVAWGIGIELSRRKEKASLFLIKVNRYNFKLITCKVIEYRAGRV